MPSPLDAWVLYYDLLPSKNKHTNTGEEFVPLAGIARYRGRRVLAQGVALVREGGTGTKVSVRAGGGGREGRIRRGEGLGAERSILSSPPAGRAANLKGTVKDHSIRLEKQYQIFFDVI